MPAVIGGRFLCPHCSAVNDVASPGELRMGALREEDRSEAPPLPQLGLPRLACPGCKVTLPFRGEERFVTCAFCGRTETVSPEVMESARAYLEKMKSLWADALEARYFRLVNAHASHFELPRFLALGAVTVFSTSSFIPATIRGTHLAQWQNVLWVAAGVGAWDWLARLTCARSQPPPLSLLLSSGIGACRVCGAPVRVDAITSPMPCAHCGDAIPYEGERRARALRAASERLDIPVEATDGELPSTWQPAEESWTSSNLGCGALISLAALSVMLILPGAYFVLESGFRGLTPNGWVLPALLVGYGLATARLVRGLRRASRAERELEALVGRPVSDPSYRRPPPTF